MVVRRHNSMISQKSLVFSLLFSDLTTFILSFFAAYYLRNNFFSTQIQPLEIYAQALPVVAALLLIIFYLNGLYYNKTRLTSVSELYSVTKATTFVIILIMAGSFLNKYDYSRGVVLIFWFTSLTFINTGRIIVRTIQKHIVQQGKGITRIAIVGSGHHAAEIEKSLTRFYHLGYRVVTKIKPTNLHDLPQIIARQQIQEVYLADPEIPHEQILNTIAACEKTNASFKVISNLFGILTPHMDVYNLEGIPAINLNRSRPNILYLTTKRLIDISASIILIVLLSPIFIIISIAIRLDSKGPAIFSHQRVGHRGKKFILHKFRTMTSNTRKQAIAPRQAGDPRVTKFGSFLRRTSLDELPQLWNVFKGEMSLVGPRPEMPFIVAEYNQWQLQRLKAKPGITGLWQILGRKDLPLHENLEYDIYYINNQSLLLDVIILFKTIGAVINAKGAY